MAVIGELLEEEAAAGEEPGYGGRRFEQRRGAGRRGDDDGPLGRLGWRWESLAMGGDSEFSVEWQRSESERERVKVKWGIPSFDQGMRGDKPPAHVGRRLVGVVWQQWHHGGWHGRKWWGGTVRRAPGAGQKAQANVGQVCLNFFLFFKPSKHCKSVRMLSQCLKIFKLCMTLYLNSMNNFLH
jgi:hypothetical protein